MMYDLRQKKKNNKEEREKQGVSERVERAMRQNMPRVLAGFFAVMLFFTVLSRITASFTVARVRVESPSEKNIEHIINAAGIVEKNREFAVVTEPDLLVKTVYIKEGQKVEKGEVLAELSMEQLAEQIAAIQDEIQILKLTNEALAENRKQEEQSRQTDAKRAKEDSEQALMDAKRQVDLAAEELQGAKDAYDSYVTANPGTSLSDEVYAQMVALKDTLQMKQNAYEAALGIYGDAQKNAERVQQDGAQPAKADYTEEINNIQIAQKEKVLGRLKELEEIGRAHV